MRVRFAEEKDIPKMLELLHQVLEIHAKTFPEIFKSGSTKYTADDLKKMIEDPLLPIFIASDDSDTCVGYAFTELQEHPETNNMFAEKVLYLDDLCVSEEARGHHIGSLLFERVKEFAGEQGCRRVTLNVWAKNDAARAFYEKEGMTPVKTMMEYRLDHGCDGSEGKTERESSGKDAVSEEVRIEKGDFLPWNESVFYQIYPLGMCGAPFENDGVLTHRLLRVLDWIPHLEKLGVNAVYFSPLFESDTHGYNTRDYRMVDKRLGDNEDLKKVIAALHEAGIRVVLDGVFNHVGRGFWAFRDVQEKKWDSQYKDWFHISFDGNSGYNDGFWYEGWEGNYDLVKLNLRNPRVTDYLLGCVNYWIDEFGIDGLRLDVAYMVDRDFLKSLRWHTDQWKKDFWLAGEMIGGDYNQIMNDSMCHSVTNYECRKGIWSAISSNNLFEIVHSLLRQFGSDPWCLYRGKHLVSFLDNHDVTRVASIIQDPGKLSVAYAFIFGMPGIPMLYYGSEWGIKGDKKDGDPALRPAIERPEWNDLTEKIAAMAKAHESSKALCYGDFRSAILENRACLFERTCDGERVMVAMNIEDNEHVFHTDFHAGRARDLITGETVDFGGGLHVPANSAMYLAPC